VYPLEVAEVGAVTPFPETLEMVAMVAMALEVAVLEMQMVLPQRLLEEMAAFLVGVADLELMVVLAEEVDLLVEAVE